MARFCIGKAGRVENVVEAETREDAASNLDLRIYDVFADPTGTTAVGATYDPKDVKYDNNNPDAVIGLAKLLYDICRGQFSIPQPSLTQDQFKQAVKNRMPN